MKETELAAAVIAWLEADGWDVYQEVQPRTSGPIADIVALRDGVCWVIECKKSYGLPVIKQAIRWQRQCHKVSIAVFRPPKGLFWTARIVSQNMGLGFISVGRADPTLPIEACEPVEAPMCEPKAHPVRDALCADHKNYAKAGSVNGGHLTGFKITCLNALAAIRLAPGIDMRDLVDIIDHHYASDAGARKGLIGAIKSDICPGVRMEQDGKTVRLYPVDREGGA